MPDRIAHNSACSDAELPDKMGERYALGSRISPNARSRIVENNQLDRTIAQEDVYAAVRIALKNTAAGVDKIGNVITRNLWAKHISCITNYLNEHREAKIVSEN